MKQYISHSAAETQRIGEELAGSLHPGDIVAFCGGLGAGKTTFTHGLARGLGIEDTVSSPTFALVQEYRGPKITLYHFDMYRISGPDDLESTGFFDYLEQGQILAVEWSEQIEWALEGESVIRVTIRALDETTREITIDGGSRF